MKTVLVPGAPWPDPNEKRVVPKKPIEKKPKKYVWRHVTNLDYFEDTYAELLQPKRGQGNPNAAKNFEKFNLRSL
jgi:hypothetical protein